MQDEQAVRRRPTVPSDMDGAEHMVPAGATATGTLCSAAAALRADQSEGWGPRWLRPRGLRRAHAFPVDAPLDRCRSALCSLTVPPSELDDTASDTDRCGRCLDLTARGTQ